MATESGSSGSPGLVGRVFREMERNVLRARYGIQMAAGISRPAVGQTPKDVVWRHGRCELWRYRSDDVRMSPPLLIVYSLFSKSYILDLRPGNSFVEQLVAAGFDVYMLDWGVADERDASNQFEDYVDDYLPAAVERVRRISGAQEVNLLGYCLGSVLALMYAAHHHTDAPLRSLTVMNSPIDLQELGPLVTLLNEGGLDIEKVLDADGNVPPQVIYQSFQLLAPAQQVSIYVDLWERMWSEEYVNAHQAMNGWATDHVPLPGGVARQLAAMVRDNSLVNDRIYLGGDHVHLSDITVPFLTVLASRDHIVPVASAGPLIDLVGSPDKHELRLDAGHVGLLVGRSAATNTIPQIIEFLVQRSDATA